MCVIKAFCGLKGYKDQNSVFDVLNYAFQSPYYYGHLCGNLCDNPLNVASLADQFRSVVQIRPVMENKTWLHHFVLSVADADMSEGALNDLMRNVVAYFVKRHFQVAVVRHYSSKGLVYNPHLHVIVNHCNLKGSLFYGNDQSYVELKNYLVRVTHCKWKFVYASASDYE